MLIRPGRKCAIWRAFGLAGLYRIENCQPIKFGIVIRANLDFNIFIWKFALYYKGILMWSLSLVFGCIFADTIYRVDTEITYVVNQMILNFKSGACEILYTITFIELQNILLRKTPGIFIEFWRMNHLFI